MEPVGKHSCKCEVENITRVSARREQGELKPPTHTQKKKLSLCYYVYKQLPQKEVQNVERQERKKQLSVHCKKQSVTHTKIKA